MENIRDMRKHVTIVGVLHIVFGGLKVITAITLFFLFNYAQSFVMDVEAASKNIRRLSDMNNIHLHADLILGLPEETLHSRTD